MKTLALFASSGVLTATLTGGDAAIVLVIKVLAAAGALVLGTLGIEKAPRS